MQIHALYTQENAGDGESGDGCAPGEGFVWPGAAGIGPDGEVICYLCGRAATPTYASYPPSTLARAMPLLLHPSLTVISWVCAITTVHRKGLEVVGTALHWAPSCHCDVEIIVSVFWVRARP